MKHLPLFAVMVETRSGNRFTYYENAKTAQEAVDEVKRYKDEFETIIYVFKQVENWK